MSQKGKVQFTMIITAPLDKEAELDRLFISHAKFVEETHYREGDKALLRYNVSKGPEASDKTDNICFILTQVYETEGGLEDHMQRAHEDWNDIQAFGTLLGECTVTIVQPTSIIHSLW